MSQISLEEDHQASTFVLIFVQNHHHTVWLHLVVSRGYGRLSNKTQPPQHTSEPLCQETPVKIPLSSTFPELCLTPH